MFSLENGGHSFPTRPDRTEALRKSEKEKKRSNEETDGGEEEMIGESLEPDKKTNPVSGPGSQQVAVQSNEVCTVCRIACTDHNCMYTHPLLIIDNHGSSYL